MADQRAVLGTNVLPNRYRLEIEPLPGFRFAGREEIEVSVKQAANRITLNAAELKIGDASVSSGGAVQKARVVHLPEKEQVALLFPKKVSGSAVLKIRYTGINNDQLHGFYRSMYLEGSKKRYLLTTQFEAADARRAFPCFDQPDMKALFNVSFVVKSDLDCISNTPVKRVERLGKGRKRVVFKETLRMSTYLLYLCVGKFDFARGRIGRIEEIVATTKGKRRLAKLPLGYAKKFVMFYEKYFGIGYPLPKVHLLGIPDFAAGAMENWGAITFRETALLGDGNSSLALRQRIAEVVAHELAHQWFGDLVTMEWWDDLWLNESFATFMSYKTLALTFKEWAMGDGLLSETLDSMDLAFSEDQLKHTHPISTRVRDPKEISTIFDNISYDKGGAILRMIEDYVGPGAFRKGLHIYLKKHAYSNATKYDLWNAIDEAAKKKAKPGESVGEVASYWVDNPGYPVVHVSPARNGVRISQGRFAISGGVQSAGRWPVPIHYATGGGREGKMLFKTASSLIQVKLRDGEFVKLNRGQKGMYRVWYDGRLLALLGAAVRAGRLKGAESWGVENDLFAFARSGKIKVEDYLSFVSKYCTGSDYPTNENMLSHLAWFYTMLYGTRLADEAARIISHAANLQLARLGFEAKRNESSFDTLLRGTVVSSLGMIGDAHVVARASAMFDSFVNKGRQMDPNLKSAILGTVARYGNSETFDLLRKRYLAERVPEEKQRFLAVLGRFNDPKLVARALDFCLSGDVRFQDTVNIPAVASSNPHARKLLLEWTLGNWQLLKKRYPAGTMLLKYFVGNLSSQNERGARDEMAAFFSRRENRGAEIVPELNRALERIDANIKLMRVNGLAKG